MHAPAAAVRQLVGGVVDDLQQREQFGGVSLQVVRGQQPQRDDLHTRFLAPSEELGDTRGAGTVTRIAGRAVVAGPASIAVQDDPDVAGQSVGVEAVKHPVGV